MKNIFYRLKLILGVSLPPIEETEEYKQLRISRQRVIDRYKELDKEMAALERSFKQGS